MKKRFVSSMLAAGVLLNSSSALAAIGDHYLKENLDKPKYTDLDVLKNLNDSQLDILKNYDKFAYEGRDGKIYSLEDVNKAFKAVEYDNSKLLDELAKDKYIPLNQKSEKPEEDEEVLKAAKDAIKEAKDAAEKDLTNKKNLDAAEEAVKAAEEAIGKLKNPDNKANLNEELDGINKGVKDARDLMDAKDEYNDAVDEANEAGVDIEDLKLEDPNAADLEELKEATKAIKDAIAEDKTDEEREKDAEKAIEKLNEAAKENLLDEDNLKAAEKALEEAKDAVNRVKDEDRKASLEEKLNEAEKALEEAKEEAQLELVDSEKEKAIEGKLNSLEGKTIEEKEAILEDIDKIVEGMSREPKDEIKDKIETAKDLLNKENEYNQDRLKAEILEEITGAYYLVESELLDEAKIALDELEEKIERVEDAEVKADFTKQVEELREVLSEKQLSYLIDSANSNIEELNKHWKEDKINFDQIKGQEEIKEELEKILSLVNKLDPAQQEKFKSETKLENDSIVTVTINKYIKEDGKEEKVESNEYYLIKSLEDELGFSDRKIKIYVDDIYRKDNKRYKIKSSIINPENGRKINIKDDIKNIEEDRNLVYSFNYSPLEVKDLYGEITEEQNGYILNIELPVFDRGSDIESISINGNILEEGENYSVSRKNIKIILGTIDEDIDFEEGYIEIKDKTFKIKLK